MIRFIDAIIFGIFHFYTLSYIIYNVIAGGLFMYAYTIKQHKEGYYRYWTTVILHTLININAIIGLSPDIHYNSLETLLIKDYILILYNILQKIYSDLIRKTRYQVNSFLLTFIYDFSVYLSMLYIGMSKQFGNRI